MVLSEHINQSYRAGVAGETSLECLRRIHHHRFDSNSIHVVTEPSDDSDLCDLSTVLLSIQGLVRQWPGIHGLSGRPCYRQSINNVPTTCQSGSDRWGVYSRVLGRHPTAVCDEFQWGVGDSVQ